MREACGTLLAYPMSMARQRTRTRKATAKSRAPRKGPVRGSWTALLASTALGVAGASMVHANVQTDAILDESRSYRLVVQSYDHGDASMLDQLARPVASVQRAVTAGELKAGVRVGLLEFRHDRRDADVRQDGSAATPLVVAWVEEGRADLELDGLRARPQPGSLLGSAVRDVLLGTVQISVRDA